MAGSTLAARHAGTEAARLDLQRNCCRLGMQLAAWEIRNQNGVDRY
jgi:hypothetical protein